jgi:GT2 family glycosyltransferase
MYSCLKVGVVVIGRNEGERLKVCLSSILKQSDRVFYVDSGSTDDSVPYATSLGLDIIELDMRVPFSAARARNVGFFHLIERYPDLKYIQFVDGDCELSPDWIKAGLEGLVQNSSCAIVAGRVKERNPKQSLYNTFCDLEWNIPAGEVKSCGGIFMVRVTAMQQVGGFNPSVIAGEEPEMCFRLRQNGWKIYRLDYLMALHDANILRLTQWWRRTVRGGYAYAEGCYLHGWKKEHYRLRECFRAWFWAFGIPVVSVLGGLFLSPWWLGILLIYPLQCVRNYKQSRQKNADVKIAFIHALFMIVDKWPQLWGQLMFVKGKLLHRQISIIEYKN